MTKGQQGECPDWYLTIVAATYLGIDPESLHTPNGPSPWRARALIARSAEIEAQAATEKYNDWRKAHNLRQV